MFSEDINKGKRANIGEIREWSGVKVQKQYDGTWKRVDRYRQNLEDFLDYLKSEFVIDFSSKDIKVFNDFYNSAADRIIRDSLFFSRTIGDLSNNLPESVVRLLSKCNIGLVSSSVHNEESGGYWVGAFDDLYNQIHINRDLYNQISGDYDGQLQYERVYIHELGHKLYRTTDYINSEVLFELWETGERCSKQSRLDYEENFCEMFAAYLMAMGDQGDVEYNREVEFLKEDCPKSFEIIKNLIKEMNENNS